METMTLTIQVPKNIGAILEEKARIEGKDLTQYVEELIEKQASRPSLDEILAPVRKEFDESGMTEEELNTFFDGLREKVWQEKQNAKR